MTKSKGIASVAMLVSGLLAASTSSAQAQDAHHSEDAPPARAHGMGPADTGDQADMDQQGMMEMMNRGGMMPQGQMPGGHDMMQMNGMMAMRHLEGHLAFFKTELKITDEQMPQWDAFANTVRANAKAMTEMHKAMAPQKHEAMTLPDRLAFEQKAMSVHLEALSKTKATLESLYAVLSPAQKKIADQIMVSPMGMPMGMM